MQGTTKLGRTHEILDHLQQKMTNYHQRKKTEQQLLNSQDEPPISTKFKSTFKLFSRPQSQEQVPTMNVKDIDQMDNKGQVGQLLQEVQAIEQLVRKKLALKEERVDQLERELQLANDQKLHLYKINCQLQQELDNVLKDNQENGRRRGLDQEELQNQLKTLKQIYQNKKNENKTLKKDEEMMRQTLKTAQFGRKSYHESELKVFKSQSRSKLKPKRTNTVSEQIYLRELVGELDKLRKMVRQKMKKSVSRGKIR